MGKGYRFNNSVTFSGQPIGSEEFLNRIVEALGIIIYRRPKERIRKKGKLNYRRNRMCCPISHKKRYSDMILS